MYRNWKLRPGNICQRMRTKHRCSHVVAEPHSIVINSLSIQLRRCLFYLFCNCQYLFSLVFKVALWDSHAFNHEYTDTVTDDYLGKVSDWLFQPNTWNKSSQFVKMIQNFVLKPNSRVGSANLGETDLTFIFAFVILFCRITKPLTFADCVGDELPLGWETVYDKQIGIYYMDHINSK